MVATNQHSLTLDDKFASESWAPFCRQCCTIDSIPSVSKFQACISSTTEWKEARTAVRVVAGGGGGEKRCVLTSRYRTASGYFFNRETSLPGLHPSAVLWCSYLSSSEWVSCKPPSSVCVFVIVLLTVWKKNHTIGTSLRALLRHNRTL